METQNWINPLWRLPHQNAHILVLVGTKVFPAYYVGVDFLDRVTKIRISDVKMWIHENA